MNKERNKTIDFSHSLLFRVASLGRGLRRLLSFKEDLEVLLLLIFYCSLAKTKSKEGRVSNLFGKEGDRFISTP
jgi:hypothetical protein